MRRVLVHPRRRRARRRRGHRPRPGRARDETETPAQAFDLEPAQQQLAGAPRAARRAATSSRTRSSRSGFESGVAELEGHPIVINKWASWCRPCRAEFPIFQQVATDRGKEVAFLGVNAGDKRPAAEKFLAERPLPYPVLRGPRRGHRRRSCKAAKFFPMTIFVDAQRQDRVRQGGRVHLARRARGRHRQVPRVNELRVDPLTGLRSIIASARADRPGGHFDLEPPPPIDAAKDPFAPGHEDQTPPEVYAVRPDGGGPDTPGWTVRVVPNLYPALTQDAHEPERRGEPRPLHRAGGGRPPRGDRQRPRRRSTRSSSSTPGAGRPSRWRPGASACARTPAARAGT